MCFRPAGVEQSVTCPKCNMKVNAVMGVMPQECPFCEADISDLAAQAMAAGDPVGAAPTSAFSVGAPGSPAVPGSPKAPTAPGAPKAPPVSAK